MNLFMSQNSPYARKVRVLIREIGIEGDVREIPVNPRDSATGFWTLNPVAKIPTLQLDDGRTLGESDLISSYLNSNAGEGRFLDPADFGRLAVLGLANGVLDTGMVARVEKSRDGGPDTGVFISKHLDAVNRAFDALDRSVGQAGDLPDLSDIAMVCAVDWIALRHPEVAIFKTRPALADRVRRLSERDSFKTTLPT